MAARIESKLPPMAHLQDLFRKCVSCVLQSWSALRLAVDNELGGPDSKEKSLWLEEVLAQLFLDNAQGLEWLDVEEYLEEILSTEYDLLVQDGSLAQVAKQLCQFYRLCCQGDEKLVEGAIQAQLKLPLCKIAEGKTPVLAMESGSDDESDGESSSMSEDVQKGIVEEPKLKQELEPGLLIHEGLERLCIKPEQTNPDTNEFENVENGSENLDSDWTVVGYKKGKRKT